MIFDEEMGILVSAEFYVKDGEKVCAVIETDVADGWHHCYLQRDGGAVKLHESKFTSLESAMDWAGFLLRDCEIFRSEKSKAEIEALKAEWLSDPLCWDIEDTPGFEAHHDELLAFRLQKEAEWTEEIETEILEKAQALDCSRRLAKYILGLEARLKREVAYNEREIASVWQAIKDLR